MEEIEVFKKNKKQKKQNIKEKKYIVDNIEDILSKISGEKLKLILHDSSCCLYLSLDIFIYIKR